VNKTIIEKRFPGSNQGTVFFIKDMPLNSKHYAGMDPVRISDGRLPDLKRFPWQSRLKNSSNSDF
jgi:hypothetical protein